MDVLGRNQQNEATGDMQSLDVLDRDEHYIAVDVGKILSRKTQRTLLKKLVDCHPQVKFIVETSFCEEEVAQVEDLKISPLIELIAQNNRIMSQIKFNYMAIQAEKAGIPGPWAFDEGLRLRDAVRYDLQ